MLHKCNEATEAFANILTSFSNVVEEFKIQTTQKMHETLISY